MNHRQRKKYIRNRYPFIHLCPQRAMCGQECDGCTFRSAAVLRRLLKRKKMTFSGWKLIDSPMPSADLFYCPKKSGQYIVVVYDNSQWKLYKRDSRTNDYIKFLEEEFKI